MFKIFGLVFLILQIHSVTSQRRDRLLRGEYLERGQRIVSTNGVYSLVMRRTNGNLAILESLPGRPTITIMEQNTRGRGNIFIMQNDGNAVLYGERGFVWFETRTQNRSARFIMMQDDGDLVVYNSSNRPIWRSGSAGQRLIFPQSAGINSTNIIVRSFPQDSRQKREMETLNKGNDKDKMFTGQWFARKDKSYLESENGMYTLGFREDGNFGIEERNGKSLWKIGAGQADSIVFHPNGNLALFANNTVQTENLLWESNTKTEEGVKVKVLLLRNNGNLVILDENNKVKWESGTAQRKSDRQVMPGNWKRSTTTTTTTTESTTTTVAVERSVDLNKNATDWFVKNWNDGNIALVLPLAVDGLDDATKKLVIAHVRSNERLGDAYAQNKFVYNKSWEDLIKRIAGNVEATPRLGWGSPYAVGFPYYGW